ncbi:MAG: putative DNA-binding domain-containing protein [Marinobacterium sp.]|nr:putative DNA-binding domain-containing protein [Marinobacterium sp.]
MNVLSPEQTTPVRPQADSADQPDFIQMQYDFAGHIRDPDKVAPPTGVEARRMQIYRDLFYSNVEGFVSGMFPVLRSLYSDDHWHAMVRDFFIRHRCQTPLFLEIGQEFMAYLNDERQLQPCDPPFVKELAHYEWVELALDISEAELPEAIDPDGDLLTGHPVQSPLAWSLAYQYPVHCIRPDYQPQQPAETPVYLLAYRTAAFEVKFMEINGVTARLLCLLDQQPELTGREVMLMIAKELHHPDPEVVVNGGLDTLQHLRHAGVLLGTAV